MDSESLPSATLSEFYRFAVLLSGSIKEAELALATACAEVRDHVDQLRGEQQRQIWVAMRIREQCLRASAGTVEIAPRLLRMEEGGEVLEVEAYILARHFRLLPEPDRSALALFYLNLFSPETIASMLKMKLEDYAATIGRARRNLQSILAASEQPHPVEA